MLINRFNHTLAENISKYTNLQVLYLSELLLRENEKRRLAIERQNESKGSINLRPGLTKEETLRRLRALKAFEKPKKE